MKRQALKIAGAAVLFAGVLACAAQGTLDDKKTLDEALEVWVTTFNSHDATAVALQYTDDADLMVATGERYKGRAAIEKGFAESFSKNPDVRVKLFEVSRMFLTPDIVIEDGKWEETGHKEFGMPTNGLYTAVLVKQTGNWLVVHYRGYGPVREAE